MAAIWVWGMLPRRTTGGTGMVVARGCACFSCCAPGGYRSGLGTRRDPEGLGSGLDEAVGKCDRRLHRDMEERGNGNMSDAAQAPDKGAAWRLKVGVRESVVRREGESGRPAVQRLPNRHKRAAGIPHGAPRMPPAGSEPAALSDTAKDQHGGTGGWGDGRQNS